MRRSAGCFAFRPFLWQINVMTPKFNSIISVFLGAVMAGCAGMKSGLVLDTAGPAPATAGKSNSDEGTLVVYSAYQINADFSSRDPNRREHSDYKILDQDKNTVKWVHNATDDMFQSAVSVKLSAGKYFIVARSNGFGIVTVPVVIAPGPEYRAAPRRGKVAGRISIF